VQFWDKLSNATKIQMMAVICMKQHYWQWKEKQKPVVVI
jgi:hypothetical protein